MEIRNLFFDMDGTIIDSQRGIFNSVHYTMDKLQIPETQRPADLNPFIGPPLRESFSSLFGMSETEAEEATRIYREYYRAKGMFELQVYSGLEHALNLLHARNYHLYLVTSKAETFAVPIVGTLPFGSLFRYVSGCEISGARSDKAELITYTMERAGIADPGTVAMIGDRSFDMLGAKQTGTHAIGVLYGYGSEDELRKSGAHRLIGQPADLLEIFV